MAAGSSKPTSRPYKLPVYLPSTPGYRSANSKRHFGHTAQKRDTFVDVPLEDALLDKEVTFENFFDRPVTAVIRSAFEPYLKEHSIQTSSAYTLNNRTFTVIKRLCPRTSGSTSAMMIALDQIQNRISSKIKASSGNAGSGNAASDSRICSVEPPPVQKELFSEDFLKWVREGETKNGKDIQEHLQKEGFQTTLVYFLNNLSNVDKYTDSDNIIIYSGLAIIHHISSLIEKSGNSVIISVETEMIGLHWFVIDEICLDRSTGHTYIYLRDAYSGKAYKVPTYDFAAFSENESGKIEAIYITSIT